MINSLIFHARLTQDPVLRVTPSGTPVCNLSVANNRHYKTESGEKRTETTFLEAEVWGKTAELINEHFRVGMPILLQGRLKMNQYEEKDTQKKRTVHRMLVDSFDFVSRPETGKEEEESGVASEQEH